MQCLYFWHTGLEFQASSGVRGLNWGHQNGEGDEHIEHRLRREKWRKQREIPKRARPVQNKCVLLQDKHVACMVCGLCPFSI